MKSHTHPLSAYSKFEMIWLGLSCGPIGIGDRIGKENVELIARCVKDDGEIIKPDVPSAPVDSCYLSNPHTIQSDRGVAVFSHSELSGKESGNENRENYKVFYLLVFNVHPFARKVKFYLAYSEFGADRNKNFCVYNFFTKEIRRVSALYVNEYTLKRRVFHYEIIAPLIDGIAFFGDVTKHVSCSSQIISRVHMENGTCEVELRYISRRAASTYTFWVEKAPVSVLCNGEQVEFGLKYGKLEVNVDWNRISHVRSDRQVLTVKSETRRN